MASVKEVGAHAAADGSEVEVQAAIGDLVELYDGAYAFVVSVDPAMVVRVGQPEIHELPVRKAS